MKQVIALFIVLFLANNIYATIHYTEVNEQVSSSTPRLYDVDLDGDNDFRFTAVDLGPNTGSTAFYVNCSKPTSFYAAENTGENLPKAYAFSSGLGTHVWQSDTGLLSSPTTGYFNNITKYLMVKFSDGTDNYYGWFLLQKSGWSLYVVSYAFSDVPDEMITPGETYPTGIQDVLSGSFNFIKLNAHQISFENCAEYDRVSIVTTDGRMLAEIHQPIAYQSYPIQASGMLFIAFFREEKLLHSAKYFVQ